VEENNASEPLTPPKKSKMLEAWIKGGRSQSAFQKRLKKAKSLESYHRELLERAGVKLEKTRKFFEMAHALLGPRFDKILSEAKGDALEGNRGDNPTGRLIYRILHEFAQG
jgi:hypothetical protein